MNGRAPFAAALLFCGCLQTPPRPATVPSAPGATVVSHIYPSATMLPENLLKFYIHFSAPMSRGEAYERIHLLDAAGKEIEGVFLELGEELWDPQQTRFTLFFDPGRIKRGLKPREELGPALEEGKSYTLVVDKAWLDATTKPLAESYRKTFKVGPPDERPLDVKTWIVSAAKAQTREPLMVRFPKPMDHAMLERVFRVATAAGQMVSGAVQIAEDETVWQFTPEQSWQPGTYHLVVATAFEDVAGNSLGKPFEVDVFRPIQRQMEKETVALPFAVK